MWKGEHLALTSNITHKSLSNVPAFVPGTLKRNRDMKVNAIFLSCWGVVGGGGGTWAWPTARMQQMFRALGQPPSPSSGHLSSQASLIARPDQDHGPAPPGPAPPEHQHTRHPAIPLIRMDALTFPCHQPITATVPVCVCSISQSLRPLLCVSSGRSLSLSLCVSLSLSVSLSISPPSLSLSLCF